MGMKQGLVLMAQNAPLGFKASGGRRSEFGLLREGQTVHESQILRIDAGCDSRVAVRWSFCFFFGGNLPILFLKCRTQDGVTSGLPHDRFGTTLVEVNAPS